MQSILLAPSKSRLRKRDFLFKGLVKCQFCGCSIVGKLKKGKYIYYHCTKARGPCDHPWVREETLDKCLVSLFEEIQIDGETVRDIVRALKDSSKKENAFRQKELERLNRRREELQNRLDKAYVDRLDGNIDDSYWRQISNKWRVEQDLVSTQINRLTNSNMNYVEQAVETLELSKAAHSLYLQRDASEKRQLLKTVLSNCLSNGVTLYSTYNKPFDLIAERRKNQFMLPGLYALRTLRLVVRECGR